MNNQIECACGCGVLLDELDKYGRKRKYISGHNGRKYADKKQYKKEWYQKSKEDKAYQHQKYINNADRCRKLKADLVIKKGGKCERCGLLYDETNACVFDFHHTTPDNKNFNVNVGTFNNKSLQDIYTEAEKCIILCSNCHRLEHKMIDY